MKKRTSALKIVIFFAIIIIIGTFFYAKKDADSQLAFALELAGDNRKELEKVIDHYSRSPADSLKRKAAIFLIANMMGKEENSRLLKSKKDYKLPDILAFSDVADYNKAIDSLRRIGQASIERSVKKDLENIQGDYLIRQIELAFKAWAKPWSKNSSFDDFCNYILPYRGANEPLSNRRELFFERYSALLDTVPGLDDPIEACRKINEILKDSIRYELKATYIHYSRTLEEICNSGYGSCDDMALVGLYVMRAVGIPVAKENTLWPRMHRGHAWCSVLGTDKKWHAFGPGETQPDSLKIKWETTRYLTLAKVYRETYAWQKNEKLAALIKSNNFPPSIYNSFFVKDVTADYLPPLSVTLPINDSSKISYLCIYNVDDWKPVDFTINNNGKARFDNMGTDFQNKGWPVIYAHCIYQNNRLIPCNPPFEVYPDGSMYQYSISGSGWVNVNLPMENPDVTYAYSYWDDRENAWVAVTPKSLLGNEALYENIPGNTLLLRTAPGNRSIYNALFTLKNGKLIHATGL